MGGDLDGTKENIIKYITDNYLQKNVILWPENTNIPQIMKRSNVFIMPSIQEGFGIVLIEAQASGLKCYVSDSVPKTTNVGGCEYIGLDMGEKFWAKKILSDFYEGKTEHLKYDISEFTLEKYYERILEVYEGR